MRSAHYLHTQRYLSEDWSYLLSNLQTYAFGSEPVTSFFITATSEWARWRLKSSASRSCGEFTGDRWIPRTNSQYRGKCFHLVTSSYCQFLTFISIQIKICAEYRDMLPRPRLVCQEPGLRPMSRSPGVPDKSSRGLGSMSRYSAQILICFIAYIFSIFNFSVGLVGNLAELPPCTVPPATVHCYQNEAAQCSSDNQISQHALLRGSRKKHSLAFMPQNWWN